MPLGLRQNNNLLHLTLDIWQEQIFFQRGCVSIRIFRC